MHAPKTITTTHAHPPAPSSGPAPFRSGEFTQGLPIPPTPRSRQASPMPGQHTRRRQRDPARDRAGHRPDPTPDALDAALLDLERTARALTDRLPADSTGNWTARPPATPHPTTPLNISIHDHLTALTDYHRAWLAAARSMLGWSARTLHLSRQSGQRCPYCVDAGRNGLTLNVNLDEGRIYCTDPACRHPDTGTRYAWQIQFGATLAAMMDEQRAATLATQQTATTSELSELLTYAGRTIRPETVRSWVRRGKLTPAGTRGPHAHPIYPVEDACALAGVSVAAVLGYDPADLEPYLPAPDPDQAPDQAPGHDPATAI
jgi:hypothetical protein